MYCTLGRKTRARDQCLLMRCFRAACPFTNAEGSRDFFFFQVASMRDVASRDAVSGSFSKTRLTCHREACELSQRAKMFACLLHQAVRGMRSRNLGSWSQSKTTKTLSAMPATAYCLLSDDSDSHLTSVCFCCRSYSWPLLPSTFPARAARNTCTAVSSRRLKCIAAQHCE